MKPYTANPEFVGQTQHVNSYSYIFALVWSDNAARYQGLLLCGKAFVQGCSLNIERGERHLATQQYLQSRTLDSRNIDTEYISPVDVQGR